MHKKITADHPCIALLKETQAYLNLSEAELLKKFIYLARQMIQKKRNFMLLNYYPSQTLQRLRQDQFMFFLEECAIEGLLIKYQNKYVVNWPGKACIFTDDASLLMPAYERALTKIQMMYLDVLI